MSTQALRFVARQNGPNPIARLVLYELASAHNTDTGQCNPSAHYIAVKTGLAVPQVKRQIRYLIDAGFICLAGSGFTINGFLPGPGEAIPANWRPDERTIADLVASFPLHHFNIDEAVRDFIAYTRKVGARIPPDERNSAFFSNIAAILSRRKPGAVEISDRSAGAAAASAGQILAQPAGRSSAPDLRGNEGVRARASAQISRDGQ